MILEWLNANSAAVNATSGVLSVIVTIGLVWLYKQQKNIQKTLSEAENEPAIVREDSYVIPGESQDVINYVLKNVGKGPAIDMKQVIDLDFQYQYIKPKQSESKIERQEDKKYLLHEGQNYLEPYEEAQFAAHYGGRCVEISERAQEDLENTTSLELLKGDENIKSLESLLKSLQYHEVSEVRVRVSMRYNTLIESNKEESIIAEYINLDKWIEDGAQELIPERSYVG